MTTPPVMTVTDELLAELDRSVRVVWRDDDATVIAVDTLTTELRRLRVENAELAQSLAESRANDQAAMGWLTSLRWASGDRGERMLPELVSHIEGLAKDAGRWRKARDILTVDAIEYAQHDFIQFGLPASELESVRADMAIDTAMATQ